MAYYVYLLASERNGTLYLGVTSDLRRRVYEHKNKVVRGFSQRYGVRRLVWFEIYDDPVNDHRPRERDQKMAPGMETAIRLIEQSNPQWVDLYEQISQ